VQICLGEIRLKDRPSRLRIGVTDLGQGGLPLLVVYERRRHITPFQNIWRYSGWIMAGKDRRVRHFPERVLRHYGYVQTIPRPPTDIGRLPGNDVAQAFTEFALHVLSHQLRGHPVPDNQPWSYYRGYMRWFVRVSHPILNPPAAIPDYAADPPPHSVPPYEEVIVEQQWVRHPPDPY